ncbi:hypothetical protein [Stenotrophomonas sp. Iso1]|uniref:hypothetical protein n=1 Tax=Stenotrophomonas sp. Iso1 TaxID=2977283 RepID=UPI0022B7B96B|nr:hypothetical protein [Stenotrophomonas sp. Iso1]
MESCAKACRRLSIPAARCLLRVLTVTPLLGCSGPAQPGQAHVAPAPLSLEQALQGFSNCRLHGFYLEGDPPEPVSPYFRERGLLTPCEVDDAAEIAYFCVKDSFYGLPVDRIEIPSSTAAFSQGLHFTVPVEQARAVLLRTLGSDFAQSAASNEGNAPELVEIPEDPQRSALLCIQPFG